MRWDFRIPTTAEHFPAAEKVSPLSASPLIKNLDISCLERFCLEFFYIHLFLLRKQTKEIWIPFVVDDNTIFEAINNSKHQISLWVYSANFASLCTRDFKKNIFGEWNFTAESEKVSKCPLVIEKDGQPNAGLKNSDEAS